MVAVDLGELPQTPLLLPPPSLLSADPCFRDCLPYPKPCAGSSPTLDARGYPHVECSGHGVCQRPAAACYVGDACVVVCACDGGFEGAGCGLSSVDMARARDLRSQAVAALVRASCSLLWTGLLHPWHSGHHPSFLARLSVCDRGERVL